MKYVYPSLLALVLIVLTAGCKKYEKDFDLDAQATRQKALTDKIMQELGNNPNGWLIYVPNLDTAIITATPVVVKFDITKGTFTTQSPFPASNTRVPALFELSSATGAPLLSFATGSIFSGWYESGNTNDYYFKVTGVVNDTISIQPYRKGNIYTSEGGIPMKMIRLKAPYTVFDQPASLPELLVDPNSPFQQSTVNMLKLTYRNGYNFTPLIMGFDTWSPATIVSFKGGLPFFRDLGMYPFVLYTNNDGNNYFAYYAGNNTLAAHIDVQLNSTLQGRARQFISKVKTDYFLIRSISADQKTITVYAVDQNGTEVISGTLEAN
ncbi:hypothetical protein [Chitinophaga sp. 212800010-3]|uniref:hypothetical protein n=1 Tax=unclassified Chitinophaga TaxID=2619133 RepID=UPI002E166A7A